MDTAVLNKWGRFAGSTVLVAGLMTTGAGVAAADTGSACVTAGTSGFTAAVVASANQTISRRTVNATGCDVGIYVADDASGVTISQVTVTGANDAGILVQNTHDVTIERSTVTGNAFHAPPPGPSGTPPGTPPVQGNLPQAFAISLFGVSHAVVTQNKVYNNARGGIGVMDDGPFDPGQIFMGSGTTPDSPVPVADVQVTNNTLWANDNGCGVVVSAFNTGNTVSDVLVSQNTINGTGFNPAGPDVGGIVAQSNGAFSTVRDITISRNTITNSAEAGVIVHAAAPGSKTKNITVSQNTLSGNNWMGDGPDQTAGVVVAVVGPPAGADLGGGFTNPGEWNESTFVSQNTMTDQFFGVWTSGPNPPTLFRNNISVTPGGSAYFVG